MATKLPAPRSFGAWIAEQAASYTAALVFTGVVGAAGAGALAVGAMLIQAAMWYRILFGGLLFAAILSFGLLGWSKYVLRRDRISLQASLLPVSFVCDAMVNGFTPRGATKTFGVSLRNVRITNQSPSRKVSLEVWLLVGEAGIPTRHPLRLDIPPEQNVALDTMDFNNLFLIPPATDERELSGRRVTIFVKDFISDRIRVFDDTQYYGAGF